MADKTELADASCWHIFIAWHLRWRSKRGHDDSPQIREKRGSARRCYPFGFDGVMKTESVITARKL